MTTREQSKRLGRVAPVCRREHSQSGSVTSSILAGTPDARSMLAPWPAKGLKTLGDNDAGTLLVPPLPSAAVDVRRFEASCVTSLLMRVGVDGIRGDADAFEALSDAADWAECCEDVRGEIRPFCGRDFSRNFFARMC